MDDLKPHAAGYLKPPEKNQFKPGKSGNSEGRPKRIDDPFSTLQKVLGRRIGVKGATRKMTIQEALVRRLRDRAIAGDRRAMALQRTILEMAKATLPSDEPKVDLVAAKLLLARMAGILIPDGDAEEDATNGG